MYKFFSFFSRFFAKSKDKNCFEGNHLIDEIKDQPLSSHHGFRALEYDKSVVKGEDFENSDIKLSNIEGEVIFFRHAQRGNREYFLLPVNFNLDEHLAQYPPHEHGFPADIEFRKDNAYAFLSLIASIPARNSDLIDEYGFVPIHMATVKNNIRDITKYKYYLLNTGVIERIGQYIPNVKSDCYRWADRYANAPFSCQNVPCTWTEDITAYESSPDIPAYPYLFHWYQQNRLIIDPVAEGYAWIEKEQKMQDTSRESWSINRDTGRKKYPVTQYYSAMLNIGKLFAKQYQAHIDDNIHRLHSVLTNLQKDYRNFITYNGHNLISIDVKNCQPYLACLILNPLFWDNESDLPLKFNTLHRNIQDKFPRQILDEIRRFFARNNTSNFQSFITKTSSGSMYEEIVDVANNRIENLPTPLTRNDAKTLMFYMLFSSNRGRHDNPVIAQMKHMFENELYPHVAELFRIIKRKDESVNQDKQHNRLSVLLQAIESEIILHKCCRKIWDERAHQIPIFTIHDSIVTTAENAEYVGTVMIQELTDCIGVQPTLALEEWKTDNLNQSILADARMRIG